MIKAMHVRLGALVFLVGLWALADRSARSAPQLPPKCGTACGNGIGPLIEGSSESGKCFVYQYDACNSCSGESGGFNCPADLPSDGPYCRTVYITVPPGFPAPAHIFKYPVQIMMDPDAAACSAYCAAQAPGFWARMKDGAAANQNLGEDVIHALCNRDPP
jgi:hypothetical protein